jgi:hypothetical protein
MAQQTNIQFKATESESAQGKDVKDMNPDELRSEVYRLRRKVTDAHGKIKGKEAIIEHLERSDRMRIVDVQFVLDSLIRDGGFCAIYLQAVACHQAKSRENLVRAMADKLNMEKE